MNIRRASFWNQDCRQFLRGLQDKPDLIFADPPFNFGEDYEHGDRMDDAAFRLFMMEWLADAAECLADNGSIWVNVPDELVGFVDWRLQSLGLRRVNWIIWHFRFGQHTSGRFVRSKSHLLWFTNGKPTFNVDDIRVESVRQQIGDWRAESGGRTPMDVWGFEQFWGRVQGNNRERVPECPNQLPEVLLQRIILACTNEDDFIVDPFCGSGTTAVVADDLNRTVATADISQRALDAAINRFKGGAVR
jgi:DNA modification methylase